MAPRPRKIYVFRISVSQNAGTAGFGGWDFECWQLAADRKEVKHADCSICASDAGAVCCRPEGW